MAMTHERTYTGNEKAIAQLYNQLLTCWNKRDAGGFAGLIADNGSVVGFDGSPVDGRSTIATAMQEIFEHHQTAAYVSKIREIRSLSDDVYLLRAVAGMVPPGKNEINPAVNAIQSLIASRKDDRWEIDLFQNTPAQFHGRPEAASALTKELSEELLSKAV